MYPPIFGTHGRHNKTLSQYLFIKCVLHYVLQNAIFISQETFHKVKILTFWLCRSVCNTCPHVWEILGHSSHMAAWVWLPTRWSIVQPIYVKQLFNILTQWTPSILLKISKQTDFDLNTVSTKSQLGKPQIYEDMRSQFIAGVPLQILSKYTY